MPDRLEQRLEALAAELEFPPTPDLAAAVLPRVAGTRPRRSGLRAGGRLTPARRSLALALAALALLAAAAAAVPPVRDAVRDLFGLGGATVERLPRLPAAPGTFDLGRPVSVADARERARFELRRPRDAELGSPDAVYMRGRPPLVQVTLAWRPGPGLPRIEAGPAGLLFTQFRAGLDPDLIQKFIGPGTGSRQVRVGPSSGFWLEGPHSFAYRDPDGQVRIEERRLAADTLLWRSGPLLLRLESRLDLQRTLEIARSIRRP
jgi:hypothetical protein